MRDRSLKKRQSILHSVLQSTHSDFYRRLYSEVPTLTTEREWAAIPFLEKEDLLGTPPYERTFVPLCDVAMIRSTSGTTGKGALVIGRTSPEENSGFEEFFKRCGVTACLHFMQPHFLMDAAANKAGVRYLGGDPGDIALSVEMAKQLGVNGISVSPASLLMSLIPYLQQYGLTEDICGLYITGERLNDVQYHHVKEVFPNAKMYFVYGSSEMQGGCAFTCPALFREQSREYHVNTNTFHFELIDEAGDIITELGVIGEIVITTLWNDNPTPLIRYKTGDMAEYVTHNCSCGTEGSIIAVTGRKHLEHLKVAGGELRVDELERVLRLHRDQVATEYQLHIRETKGSDSALLELELLVEPNVESFDLQKFARCIEKELRVGPSFTYADGVALSLYKPLRCGLLPQDERTGQTPKKVRFFDHRK